MTTKLVQHFFLLDNFLVTLKGWIKSKNTGKGVVLELYASETIINSIINQRFSINKLLKEHQW